MLEQDGYTNVKGIDICYESIDHCKSIGFDVELIKNICDYSVSHKNMYQIIIMSHVLEHIDKNKIIETLTSINNMLTDGGKLIIMVPNAQSYTGSYWAYEDFTHTTLFTSGSLLYVLKAAGFKNIKFLDVKCVEGLSLPKKFFRLLFLWVYKAKNKFWYLVTNSSHHRSSIQIFSYEIKASAIKED